jgi:hypothetical protein
MSDTIDPITLLRETMASARPVAFSKDTKELEFQKFEGTQDAVRIPNDILTAWAKKDKSGYYTLG